MQLGRFVAIKVLIAGRGEVADRRARFHPGSPRRFVAEPPEYHHDSRYCQRSTTGDCIVMEFVRGQTLADMIDAGKIPAVDCLKFAMQIADALAAAHSIGIVHRDLKPANVMVTPGRPGQGSGFRPGEAGGDEARTPFDDARGIRRRPCRSHIDGSPEDGGGRDHRHRGLYVARAGARAAKSTRARTSSPSARCSTRCSPASGHFTAIPAWKR